MILHSLTLVQDDKLLPMPQVQELNPSQKEACSYDKGHLLICAGPGTGKTHTLSRRISLMAAKLQEGERILAITFTQKAAGELEQRLFEKLGCSPKKITVGTFHGFCLKVLREFRAQAGLRENFQIASEEEIFKLMDEHFSSLTRKERREFLREASKIKSGLITDETENFKNYTETLQQKNWLDYDDIMLFTLALFENQKPILNIIQKRHPYIFIDEYQDINAPQHDLLKLLVGKNNLITAIGDPHQAIYGFRGSDVKFFESFKEDFSGAAVLSLKENYRSAAPILDASSQVISHIKDAHVPVPVAKMYESGRLIVHEAANDKQEAIYVAHQVERLVGGMSLLAKDTGRISGNEDVQFSFGDIAILYRLNAQRFAIEKALSKEGMPFHASVKKTDIDLQEQEVCPPRDMDISFDAEKITLSTLHAAKGLEFGVVFLIGCEDNLMPLNINGLVSDGQEERRLFYVGMTRAKSMLYCTRAARRSLFGKSYTTKPSPFLLNIEEDLKQYEQNLLKTKRRQRREKQMVLFK